MSGRRLLGCTRRTVLGAAPLGLAGAFGVVPRAGADDVTLRLARNTIEVMGRAAPSFAIQRLDGQAVNRLPAGSRFHVVLENGLDEGSLIHWHGQTPPSEQDGVPDLSQPVLAPGARYSYDFAARPGTHWMHSHVGLQEQWLMAAPLIVEAPGEAARDEQQIVVMLHDFTFRDPNEVLAELQAGGGAHAHHGAGALNDVEHDAFLANDRTLDDPEIVPVEVGGRVRMRIINGAAATNFWIDLGELSGDLVAVDGNEVAPLAGSRFPIAIAQRADLVIHLPRTPGAWPILALREGGTQQTGLVLATPGAAVRRLVSVADVDASALDLAGEARLSAATSLPPRAADRVLTLDLGGGGSDYVWTLNGAAHLMEKPLSVREGERVELTFRNATRMAHPMHLHGHHFQVTAIAGERLRGAIRDTVLVPVGGSVTVAFDADNPGLWALHCHNLYHMLSGMMTTLRYEV